MKKKETVRLYNFSDAELITLCNNKLAFMTRDFEEFRKYGVTTTILDDLKAKINAFSNLPTDVELLASQMEITQLKDKKAEELKVAVKEVVKRAENHFGLDSAKYRRFGASTTSTLNDSDLLLASKRVIRVANEFKNELSGTGLNDTVLYDLTTITTNFENLLIDFNIKKGERDNTQENRVEMGNAIYTLFIKHVSTGQTIWEGKNAAKYNDYIIYTTPSPQKEEQKDSQPE